MIIGIHSVFVLAAWEFVYGYEYGTHITTVQTYISIWTADKGALNALSIPKAQVVEPFHCDFSAGVAHVVLERW